MIEELEKLKSTWKARRALPLADALVPGALADPCFTWLDPQYGQGPWVHPYGGFLLCLKLHYAPIPSFRLLREASWLIILR